MTDKYLNDKPNVFDPIKTIVTLSTLASDYVPPASLGPSRSIYLDVTGSLVITDDTGTTHTFTALAAGTWHPMRVSSVKTATAIAPASIKLGW
jgi:hypothetical protein